MLAQADRFRCFAFDTPGFGLSDPLPLTEMRVADLAEATVAAMVALGLPPLPVYGTHSGAAIALELAYRFPDRVTGLMLDAVPIFTRAEVAPFEERYFAPLVADPLGGHYSATWTRFRDQMMWFPWYSRRPETLNDYDLGSPEAIHRWTQMFFAAAAHYKPAYRACVTYCDDALVAARGLAVPAVFTATTTDMLHGHLQRLPPLRDDQRIVEIGRDIARKRSLTGETLARFVSAGAAPVSANPISSSDRIRRQFVMDGEHALMLRHAGDRSRPALLLLHDVPGSSRMIEARIAELAADHFVIAPDIPGSGESRGLEAAAGMADYAAALWRMCDAIDVDTAAIEGRGFGASLAVEMAASEPGRCSHLALDGLLLPEPDERADLRAHYAPPIAIERDGAHWYRLWLRLRDGLVYWPWYETSRTALRRVSTDFDAWSLHDRTVEAMKQHTSCHHYLDAALAHDAAARLRDCAMPVVRINDPLSALGGAYGARLDQLLERAAVPEEATG